MSKNIAIIGAGFLGLTVALRCAQRGDTVTVFESGAEIGGLASAWKIGDVVWDKHYHVTLLSDAYTRKIVEDIGLADEFEWVETKTGFYTEGKLYSMSNTLEFLKFPPLDIISKLRLGGTIFYASRVKDWKVLEKISVEKWLTKLSGKSTFEKMWRPLLKAKLGDAYKKTSAAFIWATIQRMYAARNSGLKKEMFGYVRGGYARVLENLAKKLTDLGVSIKLESKIDRIEPADNNKVNVINSGVYSIFDAVVLTCPSSVAADLVPAFTPKERQTLSGVKYQGIVCASVLTKTPISDYYVTNITDETPFTGVIEMSALVDKKEFGGNHLIYLPKYVEPDDAMFELSDDEIEKRFLAGLEKMYPSFKRDAVVDFRVSKVRQVFPLPVLNYSSSVPSIKTSVPNVFVVNSAHILNGTLNVNETVALAERFVIEHKI
ncbi:MAG: NAD(P)/FAD-dependent oxidoreductase [Acidobacteria bacterium]|nr:NAD(P)/FAD-dependent oxidoreductase [Acidobacteriota bacterium]